MDYIIELLQYEVTRTEDRIIDSKKSIDRSTQSVEDHKTSLNHYESVLLELKRAIQKIQA